MKEKLHSCSANEWMNLLLWRVQHLWLSDNFFLHALLCFEAIFMRPVERRRRLAEIRLREGIGCQKSFCSIWCV